MAVNREEAALKLFSSRSGLVLIECHLEAHQGIVEREILSEIGSYLGQSDHVVLVCQVSPAVDRGEAALAAALPWVRPAIALAALLARDGFAPSALLPGPFGRRVLVRVPGVWVGRFGGDLEDLGDGLSQAEHHLVRVTAEVTGLKVF